LPEDTVLPHSDFALPHIFIGNEAYPLTKWWNRTDKKQNSIADYYKTCWGMHFFICSSEWLILDKATEDQVDTSVKTMTCMCVNKVSVVAAIDELPSTTYCCCPPELPGSKLGRFFLPKHPVSKSAHFTWLCRTAACKYMCLST
jgi:hypothetical protein